MSNDPRSGNEPTLNFNALPLVEVAIRIVPSVDLPISIKAAHNILKASALFNDVESPEQIETPPGTPNFRLQLGGVTAFTLTAHDEGIAADIHSKLILLRWRQQQTENGPAYPRFPKLKEYLRELLSLLPTAMGLPTFQVSIVNMSYSSFVIDEARLQFADKVPFMNIRLTDNFRPDSQGQLTDLTLSWSEDSGLDLRVRLEKGALKGEVQPEKGRTGAMLTTIVGKRLTDSELHEDALNHCHDRLISLFKALIDEEMLNEWGYQSV